jgi:hypothetical protein
MDMRAAFGPSLFALMPAAVADMPPRMLPPRTSH